MATVIKLPKGNRKIEAQQRYVAMLKRDFPQVYQAAIGRMRERGELNGLGIDFGSFFSSLASTVKDVAPAVLQLKQQRDLLKLQTKRAQQGIPPIPPDQFAQYATPATAASVEAPYSGFNVQPYAGGVATSKLITYGGIALVGFGLIWFLTRRKR